MPFWTMLFQPLRNMQCGETEWTSDGYEIHFCKQSALVRWALSIERGVLFWLHVDIFHRIVALIFFCRSISPLFVELIVHDALNVWRSHFSCVVIKLVLGRHNIVPMTPTSHHTSARARCHATRLWKLANIYSVLVFFFSLSHELLYVLFWRYFSSFFSCADARKVW